MSDFLQNPHYRVLQSGARFNSLIPTQQAVRKDKEKGYTDYSIELMAEVAYAYSKEAVKLAPVLKGATLEETCKKIKDFLYHHIQYKADTDTQLLRVLSRAWHDRKDGIDCKSYSLIASQILLQLGIKHHFRKIKQKNNGTRNSSFEKEWSHVYVVVPVDQSTGSLAKGHFVIDGVVLFDFEPPYLEKKDHYMNPHAVLLGTVSHAPIQKIISVAQVAPAAGDPYKKVATVTVETPSGPQNITASGDDVKQFLTSNKCQATPAALNGLACLLADAYPDQASELEKTPFADPEIKHAGGGPLRPTDDARETVSTDLPATTSEKQGVKKYYPHIVAVSIVGLLAAVYVAGQEPKKA